MGDYKTNIINFTFEISSPTSIFTFFTKFPCEGTWSAVDVCSGCLHHMHAICMSMEELEASQQ